MVPLPGSGTTTLRRAPATVYTGCGESTRNNSQAFSFEAGEVFVPSLRRNLPLPQPAVPAGTELVGGECFVTGDEQNIRVIYIADFRTPSSGLNPETTATQIISFDPTRPEAPVATESWPADVSRGAVPTRYGFMATGHRTSGSGKVAGFDLDTLKVVWSADGAAIDSRTVTFTGYGDGASTGVTFHSAKDGAETGHLRTAWAPEETFPDGLVYEDPDITEGIYIDPGTGKSAGPLESGGQVWGNRYLAVGNDYITVWDLVTSQVVFSRTGKDVEGLKIKSVDLAGNYLYINNDSDSPVIDLTTSQKVSSGWKMRPVEIISNDWILVGKGQVTQACSPPRAVDELWLCGNEGRMQLVYAPNGQYPGPWF